MSDATAASAEAGPSKERDLAPSYEDNKVVCEVCSRQPWKYKCPACETRICSLDCTKKHKQDTQCTGQRKKTEYVPMNSYNDISMWRDLAFLREVGDKVKDWGGALNLPSQEAINKKERQLQAHRKGKQREDHSRNSTSNAVIHDRLKSLSKKELSLRRALMQNGTEILFLPRDMERHKSNKSKLDIHKKKLVLTVSIHILDASKARLSTTTSHDHNLDTKLIDIMKKALPKLELSNHVLLLPMPVRPVVFSRNAPFVEAKKPSISSIAPVQVQSVKPLPKPHASLPSKPTWLAEAESAEAQPSKEATPEPEPVPRRELPKTGPRQAWLVDIQGTLGQALKGTSILEWPEFELWPETLAREEVEAERLEYIERRKATDRNDWKRRREGEDENDVDTGAPPSKKEETEQGIGMDASSSDSDSSSSLSSSSDSDSSDESEDEANGVLQINEESEATERDNAVSPTMTEDTAFQSVVNKVEQ